MSDVKEYKRGKKDAREQLDDFGPAGGYDILECKGDARTKVQNIFKVGSKEEK